MHLNIFCKNFFSKYIFVKRIQKLWFLNLEYKEKDLNFGNIKLKAKKYCYSLDKYKSKKIVIIEITLSKIL